MIIKVDNTVVKGSREDLLEKIYTRLEAEYEFDGKSEQLNCLQETMVMLSTLSKKKSFIFEMPSQYAVDFREWYEEHNE
jgi:hypothetical protein